MTGNQFRLLRKSNHITQEQIFQRIGRGDRNSIYRVEHLPYVPLPYLRALGDLLNVNLTKPDEASKYLALQGIKAPHARTEHIDWKPVFDEYGAMLTWEKLLIGYRRLIDKRCTRSTFTDVLFQALEAGEICQAAHGSGVHYLYNAAFSAATPHSEEKTPQKAAKRSKNAAFHTEKEESAEE